MNKDRYKFYLISFLLVALIITNIFAGTTGKIAGYVSDANTGEPLPGVNVLIEGTYLGAATDLDGYFVILNIPPGTYKVQGMMVGFATSTITDVRVRIDQTTELDISMGEETLELETIEIIAKRPIVEKDVAASRANLTLAEIESIPIISVEQAVGLQAGIQGLAVRGSQTDETAFVVNGMTLRDERDNTPFSGISYASVEEIQIQSGGFSAEYGNFRGGLVNVVTKEGGRDSYNFSFIGRYRGASDKHFGPSANARDSYWIRPYVDDAVAWTGTSNGAWDQITQEQYPIFDGWNAISTQRLNDDDPTNDLSPGAAQRLFLWQHRKQLDIQEPDYVLDFSFGGPMPFISKDLGGLRFQLSYRTSQSMYLIPLSDDGYRDYTWQFKLTSDLSQGMKLMFDFVSGKQTGTTSSRSGGPALFTSTGGIAAELSNGPKYIDARMFNTDYWNPSRVDITSMGLKFSHVLSNTSYYDVTLSRFASNYDTYLGAPRDRTPQYVFGNGYYVDESPFGLEQFLSTTGIDGVMRMGVGMSNSRDSSFVATYNLKADWTGQLNKFNKLRAGLEFAITDSRMNYAQRDEVLKDGNSQTKWERTPLRGGLYVEDKLEFQGMIAQFGLRLDYFNAGGDWYVIDNPYNPAFKPGAATNIDTILNKESTDLILELSPRLNVSFPISENSKLFFNYGHFRQLPTPENLYILRYGDERKQISRIGAPNNLLPRTIAYELGFEQNIWDMLLIRAAGYYKDISDQPRLVSYVSGINSVDYDISEPNSYEDIRGFELTLTKNRGNWVRGFINYTYQVNTYGYFGYRVVNEEAAAQRQYIKTTEDNYQTKPVPRPYARMNVDFFTPMQYGPDLGGFYPLESWRFNILGNWSSGTWSTWTGGGGSIKGIEYNVQWNDYINFDIRLGKTFNIGSTVIELFVDITNVFNHKYMSSGGYGFVDGDDRKAYFASLHFPEDTEGFDAFGTIAGDDQPGDYRATGVDFVPIIFGSNYQGINQSYIETEYLYYFKQAVEGVHGTGYYQYVDDGSGIPKFVRPDQAYLDQVLQDKAYIDMPNLTHYTFLNPRGLFWGIKVSFKL